MWDENLIIVETIIVLIIVTIKCKNLPSFAPQNRMLLSGLASIVGTEVEKRQRRGREEVEKRQLRRKVSEVEKRQKRRKRRSGDKGEKKKRVRR